MLTHPIWVRRARGQSPDPARVFMFDFLLFCCCCVFTFLSDNTLFVAKVCNSFYTVNLFSILFCKGIKIHT